MKLWKKIKQLLARFRRRVKRPIAPAVSLPPKQKYYPRVDVAQPVSRPDASLLAPDRDNESARALRRNLLLKALGNESVVDRLIAFERRRNPFASQVECIQAAITRWENDNR